MAAAAALRRVSVVSSAASALRGAGEEAKYQPPLPGRRASAAVAGGSGAEATSGQQGAPAQTLSARLKVATAEADAQRRRADDLQEALDRAVRAAGGGGSQGTAAPKSTVSAQTQTEGADDDRRAQERLALVESALEGLQSVLKERDGEFKRLEGALAAAGGERDAAVQRGKDAAEELEALRSERDDFSAREKDARGAAEQAEALARQARAALSEASERFESERGEAVAAAESARREVAEARREVARATEAQRLAAAQAAQGEDASSAASAAAAAAELRAADAEAARYKAIVEAAAARESAAAAAKAQAQAAEAAKEAELNAAGKIEGAEARAVAAEKAAEDAARRVARAVAARQEARAEGNKAANDVARMRGQVAEALRELQAGTAQQALTADKLLATAEAMKAQKARADELESEVARLQGELEGGESSMRERLKQITRRAKAALREAGRSEQRAAALEGASQRASERAEAAESSAARADRAAKKAAADREAKERALRVCEGEVASLSRRLEDLAEAADIAREELSAQQERKNRAVHAAKQARSKLRERDEIIAKLRAAVAAANKRASEPPQNVGAASEEQLGVLRDMVRSLQIECERRRRREKRLEEQCRRAGIKPSAAGARVPKDGFPRHGHMPNVAAGSSDHYGGSQYSARSAAGSSAHSPESVSLPSISG